MIYYNEVALRMESVDRNIMWYRALGLNWFVALRMESVDRNKQQPKA